MCKWYIHSKEDHRWNKAVIDVPKSGPGIPVEVWYVVQEIKKELKKLYGEPPIDLRITNKGEF